MSTVPTVTPTEEKFKNLPYDFTDLVIYQEGKQHIAYTVWNDRDTKKPSGKPWVFEHSNETISRDNWEQFYPGHSKVHVTNHHSLEGTFCYCWMCHGLELLGQCFRGHIYCAVFCQLALCQSNALEAIFIVLYSVVPELCLDHPSESSIV